MNYYIYPADNQTCWEECDGQNQNKEHHIKVFSWALYNTGLCMYTMLVVLCTCTVYMYDVCCRICIILCWCMMDQALLCLCLTVFQALSLKCAFKYLKHLCLSSNPCNYIGFEDKHKCFLTTIHATTTAKLFVLFCPAKMAKFCWNIKQGYFI